MRMMGWPSTIAGVAKAYEDFLDVLVVDNADEEAISSQQSAFSRTARAREAKLRDVQFSIDDQVHCTSASLPPTPCMHTLDDKRESGGVSCSDACATATRRPEA